MTYTNATDLAYSSQPGGGAPFNYVPVPDAEGYDANVTGIQVTPGGGDLNASSGAPHPGFTLRFKVRIE